MWIGKCSSSRTAAALAATVLLYLAAYARAADSLDIVPTLMRDSMTAGAPTGMNPLSPQSSTTSAPGVFDMFTNLPGDWVHWSKAAFVVDNLPLMGIIAAGTGVALLTDRQVYDAGNEHYHNNKSWHEFSEASTFIGDGKFQFGLAVLYAGYGFAFHDTKALRTASQITEVILACGGVVQLLKHLTGRESPLVATQRIGRWVPFPNQIEYLNHVPHFDAYPSGHVATALATLTVIQENYPDATWIPWVGYPAIACLAIGMASNGIHWWSDYPLSIALGYSFGRLIAHPQHDDAVAPGIKTSFYPAPLPGGGMGMGFMMMW